jgi:uncharacterized protein YdhG (YjbR/CyaY superfamily)
MENKIDSFIQNYPEEIQALLLKVREIALGVDPDLEQTISYGIPTLKKHGKVILHFAAQKAHLGIYPGSEAIAHFGERLIDYETSKGTIRIPFIEPLDHQLIEDMVRFNLERVTEE